MNELIKSMVVDYYNKKFIQFGLSPKGVDWNSIESQNLRFLQLVKILDSTTSFKVLDYGSGYGALFKFLHDNFTELTFDYVGFDISEIMIEAGNKKFSENKNATFIHEIKDEKFDYSIASGIFNVKPNSESDFEWLNYIISILHEIDFCSKKGFSFNMLTTYSDKAQMKDNLYYGNPMYFFEYCKKQFSKNVALLHDYELYEFTILVRK